MISTRETLNTGNKFKSRKGGQTALTLALTDPGGVVSSHSHDSLNRLTGLTNSNSGNFGFGYDVLGRRTSLTRPNGVSTSYTYDTLSRLLSVLHNGGSLPGSAGYTYDAAGNRTSKTAVQQASPNPLSVTSSYSYDPIYELTQAVVNSSLAESYSYDAVGNRLTSAGPVSYNYNASNELTSTSAATYTYDGNGNTLSKTTSAGTTNYAWDFENRLSQVILPGTGGTVNFKYDPFGRRIYKSSSAGTSIYVNDGDNIVQELGSAGNLLANYTQGLGVDEPLAQYQGMNTSYYQADGLGSITSLTDPTGTVAASYMYDSFGKLTASTGTITNPFQYTAREFDSETGLYYYRARYYDSPVGRFLSEDPSAFMGGMNFYTYVGNNAPNFTDPTGMMIKICSRAGWNDIFGALGGVANHAYFLDTRNGHNCGKGNQNGKENSDSIGTACAEVPGSAGLEDQLMTCCEKKRVQGFFIPFARDCHSLLSNCLKQANLPTVPAPGGRFGKRCDSWGCTPSGPLIPGISY